MNLAVDGTETINVTNSAELEDYTFSSDDDSAAAVNSTTGLVTGVAAGSTSI
ncbi:Ig-like domain-containing protein [Candidatus Saccharibacteria bacterium]|nr:Ig-like domain-containing protein [Candidatus Saccharibacteria bacterium]